MFAVWIPTEVWCIVEKHKATLAQLVEQRFCKP
jgi:hypothetical protein